MNEPSGRNRVSTGSWYSAELAARIVSQLALLLLARLLGPEGLGETVIALAVAGLLFVLADRGLGDRGLLALSGVSAGGSEFNARVAPARLVVPAGMCAAALLSLPILPRHWWTFALAVALVYPWMVLSNRVYAARVDGDFRAAGGASFALSTTQTVAFVPGAVLDQNPQVAMAGGLVLTCCLAVGAARAGCPLVPRRDRTDRRATAEALPFLSAALATNLFYRADRVAVGLALGGAAAGIYAAAFSFLNFVLVFAATTQAVLIAQLKIAAVSPARYWRTVLYLCLGGFGITLAIFALSDPLIVVFYGHDFDGAINALRVISFLAPLYILNQALCGYLLVIQGQKAWAWLISILALTLWSVIAMVGSALGVVGIAGACLVAEVLQAFGLVVLVKVRGRRHSLAEGGRSV